MNAPRGPGRPPITTRAEIEKVAVQLFRANGFENTTIQDIVAECGISKTSFFRYFPSKSAILWSAFDEHLARLNANLHDQPPDVPVVQAVINATLLTFADDIDATGVWLRRFRLQEQVESGARSVHWMAWADVLSRFVRERAQIADENFVPEAIGGAIQGALLAFIRSLNPDVTTKPETTLHEFERQLNVLKHGLQRWIDQTTS